MGDVVYCDIPYEKAKGYKEKFNILDFLNWAISRDYQVFISSYEITDERFYLVWEQEKNCTLSATDNSRKVIERIYSNKPYKIKLLAKQGELF